MSDVVEPNAYDTNWTSERERIRSRCVTALLRGATTGTILRGGLTVVIATLSLFSTKKRSSSRHPIEEIIRMTLFLGSLGGTCVLMDELISSVWGKQK